MIYGEIKMSKETSERTTPPYQKQLLKKDLIEYSKKYNKIINKDLLLKNGFTIPEINWLKHNEPEIFLKSDGKDLLIKTLKEEIVKLKEKVEYLETNKQVIGWKGKGSLSIEELDDDYLIIEHRKNKNNGDIYKAGHRVSKTNVEIVKNLIDVLTTKNKKTKYRDIVQGLISIHKLDVSLEAFNGGRNRSKYMFPLYNYI
jgi:hypothetical protein